MRVKILDPFEGCEKYEDTAEYRVPKREKCLIDGKVIDASGLSGHYLVLTPKKRKFTILKFEGEYDTKCQAITNASHIPLGDIQHTTVEE